MLCLINIQERLKNGEQDPILIGLVKKLFNRKWTMPFQETTCCSYGEPTIVRNNQRRS